MISLLALGLKPGDEVLVPAYTFIATYSAVIFAGGVPVLCEIDESLNLDPADLERRITPKTRMIVPVHMLGNPCDMDPIMALAENTGWQFWRTRARQQGRSIRAGKSVQSEKWELSLSMSSRPSPPVTAEW